MKQEALLRVRAWVSRWFMKLQIFTAASIVYFAFIALSTKALDRYPGLTAPLIIALVVLTIMYWECISHLGDPDGSRLYEDE